MIDLSMAVHGAQGLRRKLQQEQARIYRQHDKATRVAAQLLARHTRRALPRKTGKLRRHVRVFHVARNLYRVKVTGHVAHLVLGPVKEHEITPRAMRALSFPDGSARARAMHPAMPGHPEILPRVRVEHEAEAKLAAREVLFHGR